MTRLWKGFSEYKHIIDIDTTRQIKVVEEWDSPLFREFLINLEEHLGQGQAIHDYRNVLIRFEQNEQLGIKSKILVKKYKLLRKYDRFRFRFLTSKAHRSLEIALYLLQKGLYTPAPIGIIEDRGKYNSLLNCYYITEYLDYDASFDQVIKENDENPEKRRVIIEAARNIRLMHDNGIIHNDLHKSNILIKGLKSQPKLYFIDLNRARIKKDLSFTARAKDLGRLALEPQDQFLFFESYDLQNNTRLMYKSNKFLIRRKKWLAFKDKIRRIRSRLN